MKVYENEKLKWYLYIMPAFGIILMGFFTILKIVEPYNWSKGGYLVAMIFMVVWTLATWLFSYFFDIKPRKKHKLFKEIVCANGIKLNGKIVDSSRKTVGYVNGEPSSFVYYADVELEDGKKITTDALLINPKKCESNDVTVYQYEDKYYVTDFKISSENMKPKKRKSKKGVIDEEKIYGPVPIYQSVITLIFGAMFTTLMIWMEIKAADNVTRLIMLPFFVAGMGVFLQGLLPLVFYKNARSVMNIGKSIYLFAFFSYWFGFLIIMDVTAVRDNNIGMVISSLVFWTAGIFALIVSFKQIRR